MTVLTAQEVIQRLSLEPLEGEGGYYRFAHAFRGADGTPLAGTIWYLVVPGSFSSLHWLATDEVWYHCLGDSLEQLVLAPDGSWSTRRLGKDLANGECPMSVVPGGFWQGTKLADPAAPGYGYALCCTAMSPPYNPADYRQGTSDLSLEYPDCPVLGDFLGGI